MLKATVLRSNPYFVTCEIVLGVGVNIRRVFSRYIFPKCMNINYGAPLSIEFTSSDPIITPRTVAYSEAQRKENAELAAMVDTF